MGVPTWARVTCHTLLALLHEGARPGLHGATRVRAAPRFVEIECPVALVEERA